MIHIILWCLPCLICHSIRQRLSMFGANDSIKYSQLSFTIITIYGQCNAIIARHSMQCNAYASQCILKKIIHNGNFSSYKISNIGTRVQTSFYTALFFSSFSVRSEECWQFPEIKTFFFISFMNAVLLEFVMSQVCEWMETEEKIRRFEKIK